MKIFKMILIFVWLLLLIFYSVEYGGKTKTDFMDVVVFVFYGLTLLRIYF